MKTLEDIKKELTNTLKEHEILLQAMTNLKSFRKSIDKCLHIVYSKIIK